AQYTARQHRHVRARGHRVHGGRLAARVRHRSRSARPVSDTPVEARGLVKRYGRITAVDDVDLTVRPGEVYDFLVPNGAGETTTLRMLLGLIRPTAGDVKLFGRDPLTDGVAALDGVAGFVEEPR